MVDAIPVIVFRTTYSYHCHQSYICCDRHLIRLMSCGLRGYLVGLLHIKIAPECEWKLYKAHHTFIFFHSFIGPQEEEFLSAFLSPRGDVLFLFLLKSCSIKVHGHSVLKFPPPLVQAFCVPCVYYLFWSYVSSTGWWRDDQWWAWGA